MFDQSEFDPSFDSYIPEKCRDCFTAQFIIALAMAHEGSSGGPEIQTGVLDKNCSGYSIAPSDAETAPAKTLEGKTGPFIGFPVPRAEQLARCALKVIR